MTETRAKTPAKKDHRALKKLIGAVAIAGATFAAEKFIESRKKKRTASKKQTAK